MKTIEFKKIFQTNDVTIDLQRDLSEVDGTKSYFYKGFENKSVEFFGLPEIPTNPGFVVEVSQQGTIYLHALSYVADALAMPKTPLECLVAAKHLTGEWQAELAMVFGHENFSNTDISGVRVRVFAGKLGELVCDVVV